MIDLACQSKHVIMRIRTVMTGQSETTNKIIKKEDDWEEIYYHSFAEDSY